MPITFATASGFTPTTEDDEVTYLNGQFQANIDADLDVDPDQPFGQIIGIFAKEFQQATELLATAFNMVNPNAAEGILLANVCALTGTSPEIASYGNVLCELTLNPGTTVPAGSVVYVAGQPAIAWSLDTAVTYAGDGTDSWLSPPVTFTCTQTGAINALAGTVTGIGSPIAGWVAVTNPAAATPGHAGDTDTTLRIRRNEEVTTSGAGNINAVQAAVAAAIEPFYSGNSATVWVGENTTGTIDANGVPGHSIHVVYWDGTAHLTPANTIAQAIFDAKADGVGTYGALSGTATDALGGTHTVYFDQGASVNIYINLVTTPAITFSGNTTQYAAIESAVVAYVQANWNFGTQANIIPIVSAAMAAPGNGITDIPHWQIDITTPPSHTANIAILPSQIPVLAGFQINGT
jgi:uncharacterized phage protein gp47/JayE